MKLSTTEEELMEVIWKHEKAFMKDILESYTTTKPATTTIATLLKRMQEKGFVGYTLFGNSRQYYPLIEKEKYFGKQVKGIIKNNFNNSALQFASFFTTATDLTSEELESLKKIINNEIKKKKK